MHIRALCYPLLKHFMMKKNIALLSFYCLPMAVFSQLIAPGIIKDIRTEEAISGNRETILWSEDFADGIEGGWENSDAGGVAYWEYRGPFTNPTNEVGSRGLCTDASAPGNVIESPSWGNGFVLFDSNWWDNPDLPCTLGNFGTGPAPAPHLAVLTTPSIDLSSNPDIALRFNQFVRNYDAEMRVEVSANGGPWQTVFDNSSTPALSATDMTVQIPISSAAGGQSDVKIRFVFEGTYYYWQLDDICIVDIFANDLATRQTTFGDFDLSNVNNPTGFEWLEYTKYPDEMAPLLKFSTQCDNVGSIAQTDCRLNVEVVDVESDAIIHTAQSTEGFDLQPGASLELNVSDFQMPNAQGFFHLHFATSQTETDENEMNNADTAGFNITDCVYARDYGFTNAVFVATPELALLDYEIGNVFLPTAANQSCYSISVAIASGTSLPSTVYAKLYEFDAQESIVANEIGETSAVSITTEMFNSYGEGTFLHLLFDAPIPVENGNAYLAVVGSTDGADNVLIAFSGSSPESTSWVRFLPNQWFYLTAVPMVRMNFCTSISVEEVTSGESTFSVFPNPASTEINLDLIRFLNEEAFISITDDLGKRVMEQIMPKVNSASRSIDIESLPSGVYFIQVQNEKTKMTGRFLKM